MKLAKRRIPEDLEGEPVSLLPEDEEDMWHAYNLIIPGDIIHAFTSRKVAREDASGEVTRDTERKHLELAIRVKTMSFDPVTAILRISGIIASPNEAAPMGSSHSIEVEKNRAFTIIRTDPDGWDSVATQALQAALSDDKNGALAAVVMQEGLANICLITQFRTVLKTKVEHVVPKKRDTSSLQDAGMRKFFEKTLSSLLRAADFSESRPILLASPGFVAEDFRKYIAETGRDKTDKVLTAVAKMALVVHAPSGHVHSLNQVLQSAEVKNKMKDVRYTKEGQLMDTFMEKLKRDEGWAWYGVAAVEKAISEGAVGQGGGVLLINNSLFRSENLDTRKRFVALVDKVQADGGEARVLSSEHSSGQRLKMLGDIAAILTYPILDLDDNEEEEEENDAPPRHREEDDFDMMDGVI